jgi:hypothetical protein
LRIGSRFFFQFLQFIHFISVQAPMGRVVKIRPDADKNAAPEIPAR